VKKTVTVLPAAKEENIGVFIGNVKENYRRNIGSVYARIWIRKDDVFVYIYNGVTLLSD